MKRRYSKELIEELEKAILREIIRTEECRDSLIDSDREKGRESAETLLTLAHAWNLLTQRGVK